MKLLSWCQTDVGKRRNANQDFYLIDSENDLYILADGMGGQPGGAEASEISINSIKDEFQKVKKKSKKYSNDQYHELIQVLYNVARESLNAFASKRKELRRLGTTIVLALFSREEGKIYVANVGDSRAYLYKDENLWQITEDHTLLNELFKAGSIDDLSGITKKNVLTRAVIVSKSEIRCVIFERKLSAGEIVLLCSDGLHGMVDDAEITEVLRTTSDTSKIPAKLVSLANANGGEDNITVLVLKAVES